MQSWLSFELDGVQRRVEGMPLHTTLADYLTGIGVGQGRYERADRWLGGAPVIMLDADSEGLSVYRSIDSTRVLLPQVAGCLLYTAEGILRLGGPDHPVVRAFQSHPALDLDPSACAAWIVAFFEAYYRPDLSNRQQLWSQLDAAISRTADTRLVEKVAREVLAAARSRVAARKALPRASGSQQTPDLYGDAFSALLFRPMPEAHDFVYVDEAKRRYYRPQTVIELLRLKSQYPEARVVSGGGSFAAGAREGRTWPAMLSMDGVSEMRLSIAHPDHWEVGAAVTLTALEEALGGEMPVLSKMLRRHGTRAMRNRATLGGHLAAADPRSDLAPLLMALDSRVVLSGLEGEREAPLSGFFETDRRTMLRPGEILRSILIPRFTKELLEARGCTVRWADYYKVAARRQNLPGVVSAAFAIELDPKKTIRKAWLAYSGVGDRPIRARQTEAALVGKPWDESTLVATLRPLDQEISAIGDDLASREYRRQLVVTLLQKFFYQHPHQDQEAPVELGATAEFLRPAEAC